jgi:citrate lyase subunit beta/citryl-CoA lyase
MFKQKRRSLLFIPSIKTKFYEKALNSDADSIIFDMDDSVAPSAKETAREVLRQHFPRDYTGSKELSIRINHPKSPFYHDDVVLMRELKPHSITIPKVESAVEVAGLVATLEDSYSAPVNLMLFIETLVGFYNLAEILSSSDRITAATLGTEDLCGEMVIERVNMDESPILNRIMVELAMQCHLNEIQCLGPVYRGFGSEENLKALERESLYLKQLNAKGQFAIHPTQVPVMNRVFDISAEQLDEARQTLAKFEAVKEQEGTAVISRGQQMEDTPSIVRARKLLNYAEEHGFVL